MVRSRARLRRRLLKRGDNELAVTVPAGPLNAGAVYGYIYLELDAASHSCPLPPRATAGGGRARALALTPPSSAGLSVEGARMVAENWPGARQVDLAALAGTPGTPGTLADWAASRGGCRVALAMAGDYDFQTVSIVDADSGLLPDRLRWVKHSQLQFTPDAQDLFYSGYGEPTTGPFLKEFGVHRFLRRKAPA